MILMSKDEERSDGGRRLFTMSKDLVSSLYSTTAPPASSGADGGRPGCRQTVELLSHYCTYIHAHYKAC